LSAERHCKCREKVVLDGKGGKDVGFCGAVVDSKAFPGAVSARVQNVDDIGTFWL